MNRYRADGDCGRPGDGSEVNDHVRGFPHTYSINDFGQAFGVDPATRWTRGDLVRTDSPLFAPPPLVPMYDPTIAAHPETFRKPH